MFKDIPGYESFYQINSLGEIRSLDRVITRKNGIIQTLRGATKSNVINDNGYLTINLYKQGKAKCFKIHRLLGLIFIDNPSNYKCINHIDGKKTNNNLSNLEWCSHSQNNKHAFDTGLRIPPKTVMAGDGHARYISDIKATNIKTGEVITLKGRLDIDSKGFINQNVYRCVNGKQLIHKGHSFERVSNET